MTNRSDNENTPAHCPFSRREFMATGIAAFATALQSQAQPARNPILWAADWNPDGKSLAVGGNDGILRLLSTDLRVQKSHPFKNSVQCLDWHPSGKLLAIALDDHPTQHLNAETDSMVTVGKTTAGSRALKWSPDGEMLAVADTDGILNICNKDGTLIRAIKKENGKSYLCVDWHPTKNLLVTGSDKIRIFEAGGALLKTITHRPEDTIVLTVQWHPNGEFFASGDYGHDDIESLLQFWAEDGKLLKTMRGSKAEYRNVRWSGNGERLASASDALRVWTKEGQPLHVGNSPDLLWGLDWDPKGASIITSSAKGSVRLWTSQANLLKENLQA